MNTPVCFLCNFKARVLELQSALPSPLSLLDNLFWLLLHKTPVPSSLQPWSSRTL